jgi:hypothetical protein
MRRSFYVAMAVLLFVMIVIGFWPSYFGPLFSGTAEAPWILHVHGAIYMGWMALLIVQTWLAATGNIRAHRKLGTFGIGLGSVVFALGLLVSFVAPVMTFNAGTRTLDEAAGFMLIPLGDMILFGGLFVPAVALRNQPEKHKRLMLMAVIAIAFAAIFRMQALGLPLSIGLVLWFALPIMCMIYDWRTQQRVHPIYLIGFGAMIIIALRIPFSGTETWLSIARPIMEALT